MLKLATLLMAVVVAYVQGDDDGYFENSRYTGTLSLLVDSTDVTLQYIYPHPENPQSVVHALYSKRYTKIQTRLIVAGGIVGDGTAFLLDDGCHASNLANFTTTDNVVLIVRGGCSFAVKANNIAAAGAVGMIVVDNCRQNSESCSTNVAPVMSLGTATVSDSVYDLVAVAVTEDVGIQMLQLNMQDNHITVTIEKNFPEGTSDSGNGNAISYQWPDDDLYYGDIGNSKSMFGHFVLFSGCITMAMLGLMSFLQFRQNKRRARRRADLLRDIMAQQELDAEAVFMLLPVTPYVPDPAVAVEDRDVCCICLDNFETDDNVRKLPCKHVLHKDCIDPWLETHVTCPLCKDDIYVAVGIHDPPPPEPEVVATPRATFGAGNGGDGDGGDGDVENLDDVNNQRALAEIVVISDGGGNDDDNNNNSNNNNDNDDVDQHSGSGGGRAASDADTESANGFGDDNESDDNGGDGDGDGRWNPAALDAAARRSISTPVTRHTPSDVGSNDSLERIPLARPSTNHSSKQSSRSSLAGGGGGDSDNDDEIGNDEYISIAGAADDGEQHTIPGQVARTAL